MRCAYTAGGTVTWARLPGAEGGGDRYYAPFFVLGRGDACRTVPFTMLGALFPDIAFIGISASIRPATVPIMSIKDSLQWPAFGIEGVDHLAHAEQRGECEPDDALRRVRAR